MEIEEKEDLVVQETDKNYKERLDAIKKRDLTDAKFGYQRLTDRTPRNGWLVNVQPSESFDELTKTVISVVDFYFLQDDGSRFKISYPFKPYLYVGTTPGYELHVASYLGKKYNYITIDHVEKENLDLKNHLSGLKSKFLKISFPSTMELMRFKKEIMPQIYKNQNDLKARTNYNAFLERHLGSAQYENMREVYQEIIDIREYDLPYHMRVCIDEKFFVGLWYTVIGRDVDTQRPIIKRNEDLIDQPDPV
uniref:DNA polymerase epsilon catalytic subunit n=1 Tax=Acrobeloides nanus TaxID=290746 RepID=A0A914D6Q0_9BILA